MIGLNGLREELNRHGQDHLIQFWEKLTAVQQELLYLDIKSIDLPQVTRVFRDTVTDSNSHDGETLDELLQPLPNHVHESITRTPKDKLRVYKEKGLKEISEGHVAALLLAGGQGTRLGVNYPKGMYDVGLPSHKSLYQLQGERIKRLETLAHELTGKNGSIPWYIMTSEATKEPTLEFFEKHNFFGLSKQNITIFEQSTLPCFAFDGKIILESPYKIARAPDGNGGLYRALNIKTNGNESILENMQKRGIKHIHVYCVDNILVKIADPTFIGYCMTKGSRAAAKVVEKAFPTEAVGIFSIVSGKYQVVEYSEVSLQTAQKRNSDGRLTFNAGNICNHYFTFDYLKDVATKSLKHHIAKKKIPYVDDTGKIVKPEKPNGIKLEKFVFDVFEFAKPDEFVVWEVLREDEFSPLKNGEGSDKDTPTTVRQSLYNLHQRYILHAGGKFIDENGSIVPLIASPVQVHANGTSEHTNGNTNGNGISDYNNHRDNQVICEISPLMSYDGEGLEKIVSGKMLRSPLTLLGPNERKPKTVNGDSGLNCTNGVTETNGHC